MFSSPFPCKTPQPCLYQEQHTSPACRTAVLCVCKHPGQVSDYRQKLERSLSPAQRRHIPGATRRAHEHAFLQSLGCFSARPAAPCGTPSCTGHRTDPSPEGKYTEILGLRGEPTALLQGRRIPVTKDGTRMHQREPKVFPEPCRLSRY